MVPCSLKYCVYVFLFLVADKALRTCKVFQLGQGLFAAISFPLHRRLSGNMSNGLQTMFRLKCR
jgi:hypothetical protein